jgi:hypothetical protein
MAIALEECDRCHVPFCDPSQGTCIQQKEAVEKVKNGILEKPKKKRRYIPTSS